MNTPLLALARAPLHRRLLGLLPGQVAPERRLELVVVRGGGEQLVVVRGDGELHGTGQPALVGIVVARLAVRCHGDGELVDALVAGRQRGAEVRRGRFVPRDLADERAVELDLAALVRRTAERRRRPVAAAAAAGLP